MMNMPQNFNMNNNNMNQNYNTNQFLNQNNLNIGFNNINNNLNNQNLFFNVPFQNMPNINLFNNNLNQNENIINLNQISNEQQNMSLDLRNKIQKNNLEMKHDNFWIDINQLGLIYSIIEFYHRTGNNYLNIDDKYQIMNIVNRINPNLSTLKINDEILDPLYYIEGPKKIIKFINSDFKLFNVKIPKQINMKDLYSIVCQYKCLSNTEIALIYKNYILTEDETSIDCISEGDVIIILENRNYPDNSFYDSIMKKNNDPKNIIIIRFIDDYREKPIFDIPFPSNITFEEMVKIFNLKFGYCQSDFVFLNYMFTNKKVVLKELFPNKLNIIHYRETGRVKTFNIFVYGKRLTVEVELGDGRGTCITCLGLLNSNKLLIKRIEAELMIKIKNIYLRNTKLNIKDEMSLKSMGIINNCTCLVEKE